VENPKICFIVVPGRFNGLNVNNRQFNMTSSMDIKPQMIVNQVALLAKKIAKLLMYALAALVLLYLIFKGWEYKAESDQQQAAETLKIQQSEKFANLSKHSATYSPLVVGSSSLNFVKRGANESLFQYLLGDSHSKFIAALDEVFPLVYVGPQIFGSGCHKLGCIVSKAAFVIDPAKGRIYAGIIEDGKITYFGLAEGEAAPSAFEKWAVTPLAGGSK